MKNAFVSHALKLLSSRIAIQCLIIPTTPIISRLFSPASLGVFQIFDSLSILMLMVVCLDYHLSIPLGKTSQDACASFLLSLGIAVIMTFGSIIGVLLGRQAIAAWYHIPELASFLWLLPVCVLMYGMASSLNAWASREGLFGIIAWAGLLNVFCDRILTILCGYLFPASALGLFLGRCAGIVIETAILLGCLGRTILTEINAAQLSLNIVRAVGVQHKNFPLFSAWDGLLASFSAQLPMLIFGRYFSSTIVGYYSLAVKVNAYPMDILGNVIAQVFFPAAAKEYRDTQSIAAISSKTFTRLAQLMAFPMAMVGLFGAMLFAIVFGQQWTEAGVYAQILSAWFFLIALSEPLEIFAILNRQDVGLYLTLLSVFVRSVSLLIGMAFGVPKTAIGIFVLCNLLLVLINLLLKLRLSQVSEIWASKIVLKYAMIACLLLLPVKYLSLMIANQWLTCGMLAFATLCYFGVVFTFDPSLQQFVRAAMQSNKPLS